MYNDTYLDVVLFLWRETWHREFILGGIMLGTVVKRKLEGLSEKIFLDRYALKDPDTNNTKVGDTVLVLTKDDPKFPAKEIGEVTARQGRNVTIQLRSGDVFESTIEKLTLTREKTPEELWIV
jgi:ribonucleoside-diphosphate reductase alpha chain